MAEQQHNMLPRDEDTTHPRNPPNAVLNKGARRAAVWSYFVPIVVLFAAIAVVLVYWIGRPPHSEAKSAQRSEIGTVGSTEGGFNPKPQPDDVRDEIKFRGGDLSPITSITALDEANSAAMTGRRVEIDAVKVDSVSGNTVWVRNGDRKYAIVTPDSAASVKAGETISIRGRVEADDRDSLRIVADQILVR
jgi:hypothetical protein